MIKIGMSDIFQNPLKNLKIKGALYTSKLSSHYYKFYGSNFIKPFVDLVSMTSPCLQIQQKPEESSTDIGTTVLLQVYFGTIERMSNKNGTSCLASNN
jgi:hypothetical protein